MEIPKDFTPVRPVNQLNAFKEALRILEKKEVFWKTWEAPCGIAINEMVPSLIEVEFNRKPIIPGYGKTKMPILSSELPPAKLMDALDFCGLQVFDTKQIYKTSREYIFRFYVIITEDFNMQKFADAPYEC